MKTASCLLSFVVVMCACHVTSGYPGGAPHSDPVCRDMFPNGHRVDAQTRTPPYLIQAYSNVYTKQWDQINVTITAQDGYFIAGLLLQARRTNCSDPAPVGVFDFRNADSSTIRHFQPIPCMGRTDSAVTHTNDTTVHPVTVTGFTFLTPVADVGHFYFVATIAKQKDIFWTGVTSDVIRKHGNNAQLIKCPMRSQFEPSNINTTPNPNRTPSPSTTPRNGCTFPVASVSLLLLASLWNMV